MSDEPQSEASEQAGVPITPAVAQAALAEVDAGEAAAPEPPAPSPAEREGRRAATRRRLRELCAAFARSSWFS